MSITITPITGTEDNEGKRKLKDFLITFDSSYPRGGYPISAASFKMARIPDNLFFPASSGLQSYMPFLDYKNKAIRIMQSANSLIVEEAVTVTSNKGTLANIPGYILAVQTTAGTTLGAFTVIPKTATPVTTQVAVNFATGQLTFLSSDAITKALVTYIPMGVGPFVPSNQVVDEAVTLSSSGVNLANQASLIQYVYDTHSTGTLLVPCGGTVAAASGQVHTALRNSTNTTLTVNAAQNTDAGLVTYWKASAFGTAQGFTAEASIPATTGITTAFSFPSIVIPTYGTQMVGLATATIVPEVMEGPSGTSATGVVVWNPFKNTFSFNAGDSLDHVYLAYITLNASMVGESLQEVAPGTNLASVTMRATGQLAY